MTIREAWNALIAPRLRKSNAVPDDESRRMNETKAQWLKRLERLER